MGASHSTERHSSSEAGDFETWKNRMNPEQIKDEIRNLSRIDKIEIYRWIDEQAAADLLSRIGVYRSRGIRQGIEQKSSVINWKNRVRRIDDPMHGLSHVPNPVFINDRSENKLKALAAIFIIGAVATFDANASTFLENLQVDADSTDSPFLRQLIEYNISVRKAEDMGFITALEEYYGEHAFIEVDLGTVIVELLDKWRFVNRDLQRRAKIIGLSYLIWHPEDRDVTVCIRDYKNIATDSDILRNDLGDGNAIRKQIDNLTKEAGLDREPFNRVVKD
jgi:hypothetical protein